jgi:CelD/BcsL family acetyltransferase involved in cellulose biosynthesis
MPYPIATHPETERPLPCVVQIVRTAEDLDGLKAEWDELFASSPAAVPPLGWEWVRGWWRVYGQAYGEGGRGLRILTCRCGDRLVGVLPLYRKRNGGALFGARRLGFVSTGEDEFEGTFPEYLDLLAGPGEEPACLEALTPVLLSAGDVGWDVLELSELAAASPLRRLATSLRGGWRVVRVREGDVCWRSGIAGGFEAYLGRISHENRRQARKILRDVEQEGLTFEVAADAAQIDVFFEQMVALHRRRWAAVGKAGAFAPRHAEFHRNLALALGPAGGTVLARLSHQGNPLAVVYGYRVREKLHCYQQGVAAQGIGRVRSPGTAAWLLLMRRLAAEGVTCFDHQKGVTQFKERFCNESCPMLDLRVIRPTARAAITAAADFTRRAARKAIRILKAGLLGRRQTQAPPSPQQQPKPAAGTRLHGLPRSANDG